MSNKLDERNFATLAKVLIDSFEALIDRETDIKMDSLTIAFLNHNAEYKAKELLELFNDQYELRTPEPSQVEKSDDFDKPPTNLS